MKFLFFTLLLSFNLYADSIPLPELTQEDLASLTKDLSANFAHTTISSSKSLGSIFGFEAGLVAGVTNADSIDRLIEQVDPSQTIGKIPHAILFGRISIPKGFTIEATYLPEFDISDFEINSIGGALAWDLTNMVDLPIDLGFKLTHSKTDFAFQTRDPNNTSSVLTANYKGSTTGLYAYASKKLVLVEPYVGVGIIKGDGQLDSTASLFQYTAANSSSSDETSTHLILGANVNLILLDLSAEYSRLFDTDRLSAKFNISF